jgi:D-alanyl-D-alanine carboxypeptidase (penicillin-binding protein 5/6)
MNANGLSHEEQYSSARDLAKITYAALQNEIFVELFGAVDYTVPATNKSEERKIVTTNYLMSKETIKNQYDQRVTGGKTGALSTTDRSLISTAESNGRRYLAVVMSARGTVTANGLSVKTFGSFEETRALLNHGFDSYSIRQVLDQNLIMGQFSVDNGENDVIGCPGQEIIASMPKDATPADMVYKAVPSDTLLTAPIQKGQVIGTVEVWYKNICVGQCDMIAMHGVDQPGVNNIPLMPTAEEESDSNMLIWLLVGGAVILGVVAIGGGTLLVMRMVRKSKIKRRHKLINERSY